MNDIIEVCASLLECCIFIRLCNGFLGFKNEKMKWAASVIAYVPLALVDTFLCQLSGFENISIIILLLILLGYSCIFLKGKKWEKLLVSIIPTITALPINMLVMSIFGALCDNDRAAVLPGGVMRIPVLFFTKSLFFFVCEIIIRIRKKGTYSFDVFQWIIQLSCFLISFIITTLLWNISRNRPDTSPVFLIIFLLIGILNVLLYVIMNKMQRDSFAREENRLLKASLTAQERLVNEAMAHYSEIKTLRHDMRHYLTAAAEMITAGKANEAKEYIENVVHEKINPAAAGINTGSAVIDAVINNKISLCAEKGIGIKCAIDTGFTGANDVDLSILLSNLLDNAIAGCSISEPSIELTISRKKSLIYIAVCNSIDSSVLENNPELVTNKADSTNHGFGIRSIKNIVKKYEGSVDFEEDNLKFIAEVWLKMEK